MSRSPLVAVVLVLALIGAGVWFLFSGESGAPPVAAPGEILDRVATPDTGVGDAVPAATEAGAEAAAPRAAAPASALDDASAATGTLAVTVQWPGEVAAADVMIFVRRAVSHLPSKTSAQGTTDAAGRVVFADLPLGKVILYADRGDRQRAEVVAGVREVVFTLKGGVAVRGTVHGPDGAAVPGAGVWLQSTRTHWTGGRVLTKTDARGAFALEHIDPHLSLGAVAPNYAPSKLVDLDLVDTTVQPVTIRIELRSGGGGLSGIVTDAAGDPVAKARIAAGRGPRHILSTGRRITEQWSVRTATTDAAGRFSLAGLTAGAVPVAVRADGFGFWRGEAAIEAGATAQIQISLQRAAVVFGTVTDADDAPIAGALISGFDRPPETTFISGGQIDFDEVFGNVAALSDAAGRYRLEDVTPGTVHLFAQLGWPRQEGVSVAYVAGDLDVAAGGEVEWNPQITGGQAIDGIVLYRDGHAMPNVFVTLTDEQSRAQHVQTNDDDGKFRFLNLDGASYAITVQYWDAPPDTPRLEVSGVAPDGGRVELRAPFDKPVKEIGGVVMGRIDDAAGRIANPRAAVIILSSDKGWFRRDAEIVDGAFRFDRVTPGRFRLTLMEGATVVAQGEWHEMTSAATVDAGVLRTEPAGAARITVERSPGTEKCDAKLYLKRQGYERSCTVALGLASEVEATNLTPGDYELTGHGSGMATLRGKLTVRAGETTELGLRMRPGVLCRFDVWFPDGHGAKRYHYRIVDAEGDVFEEADRAIGRMPTRPMPFGVRVPIGRWTIEFETDAKPSGSARFVVGELAPEAKIAVRVDLQ